MPAEPTTPNGSPNGLEVEVDEDSCIGAGNCVFAAPEVFDQRPEDGIVILLQRTPPAHQREAVRKAAQLCPSRAIRVREGGK
jgi:ferredoxin